MACPTPGSRNEPWYNFMWKVWKCFAEQYDVTTSIYTTNAYYSELDFCTSQGDLVTCTTLWDKVCQWLAAGQWFAQSTPVSLTNQNNKN